MVDKHVDKFKAFIRAGDNFAQHDECDDSPGEYVEIEFKLFVADEQIRLRICVNGGRGKFSAMIHWCLLIGEKRTDL